MDAGSGLMFLACVAIEKRRNQSNSSTLDVVMAALPSILRDTDILRVFKDTLLKLQNRQTLLYNAFNSVYTNEINILR
jgi:hypothetical protein